MNVTLLRQASKDGLGVRRWTVGDPNGRNVKIFRRPRSCLARACDAPWTAAAFDWRFVDQFPTHTHQAAFWDGHGAFVLARQHLAPIIKEGTP